MCVADFSESVNNNNPQGSSCVRRCGVFFIQFFSVDLYKKRPDGLSGRWGYSVGLSGSVCSSGDGVGSGAGVGSGVSGAK